MTPVAERVRTHRARRKSGGAIIGFVQVADEIGTIEMLIAAGLLRAHQREDRMAIARAVGTLVDTMTKETNWS